jgi:para-aminobenzoate synthetase component 1
MGAETRRIAVGLERWLARPAPGTPPLPAMVEPLRTRQHPLELFLAIARRPYAFLLDSALDIGGQGRFSFMGCEPAAVLRCRGDSLEFVAGPERLAWRGDPFEALDYALHAFCCTPPPGAPPFVGGAVGYFGYDLREHLEPVVRRTVTDLPLPDMLLGLYDAIVAYDHERGESYLCSTGYPEREPNANRRWARQRLQWLRNLLAAVELPTLAAPERLLGLTANFTHEGYLEAVEQALEYIAAGDIYQVNLSQRFSTPYTGDPLPLYFRLREVSPAPFAAYLGFDEVTVLSSSPERFLRVDGRSVRTRPIKGTRRRGRSPEEDTRLARELWASPKDQAELVMIVDLERNDLGRVCEYGSVEVTELKALEAHPTVFHLVATVEGQLRADATAVDCLRACFPGGSITGAPKIRAMEIIEELEPTSRGVYTGAIGYMGWNGQTDLNIAIRTMVHAGGRLSFQVGGGIVADSEPEAEYQETLDKAQGMLRSLQGEA